MNRRSALMTLGVAGLALALYPHKATADIETFHLGWFSNSEFGEIDYEGDFASYISVESIFQGSQHYNVITIDLPALIGDLGFHVLHTVMVQDTGENQYNNSPGADIDLMAFIGLMEEIDVTFSYDGPVELHSNETAAELAQRVAELDAQSGVHYDEAPYMVSLGDGGMLTASLTGWFPGDEARNDPDASAGQGGNNDPDDNNDDGGDSGDSGDDGDGGDNGDGSSPPTFNPGDFILPTFQISEAGMAESFDIYITVEALSIPAPGSLALMALASVIGLNRRRRRG